MRQPRPRPRPRYSCPTWHCGVSTGALILPGVTGVSGWCRGPRRASGSGQLGSAVGAVYRAGAAAVDRLVGQGEVVTARQEPALVGPVLRPGAGGDEPVRALGALGQHDRAEGGEVRAVGLEGGEDASSPLLRDPYRVPPEAGLDGGVLQRGDHDAAQRWWRCATTAYPSGWPGRISC